jgi:CRISPR-associated endoribonuclease Cas6
MDLFSLILTLRPLKPAAPEQPLPRWWGTAAHHLCLQAIQQSDENLSAALHEGSELRPFTTSTLMGRFPGHQLDLQADYLLRFTGLNRQVSEALYAATQTGAALAPGAVVQLEFLDFQVRAVWCENGSHPLAGQMDYSELAAASLLEAEAADRYVNFRFASPTGFHRNGRQVPYPLPELVIGSLLERWNAFAPIAFPAEARRYAEECLYLSQLQIRSRGVKVAAGYEIGLVGSVSFGTLNYDRYWMSLMQTLARFSYYSGVGVKTGMGMGQCRNAERRQRKARVSSGNDANS